MSLSPAQRDARHELLARLNAGHYRMQPHACPCGIAAGDVVIAHVERYGLPLHAALCVACATVRIDPHLDDEALDHFYRHLYRPLYGRAPDAPAYFQQQRRVGEKLLATLRPPSGVMSVWELGCGSGGALSVFQERGHRTYGNDFESALLDFGRAQGVVNLHLGPAAAVAAAHRDVRFDLVVLHHVLEHVSQPCELLSFLAARLAPGGRIVVVVPDLGRIGRYPFPAGDALLFFHVAHRYNYSRAGLEHMARRASLRALPLKPAAGFPTAWSTAPEIWIELVEPGGPPADEAPAAGPHGPAMLRYLRRTETLHRFRLCLGQLRRAAARLRLNRVAAPVNRVRRALALRGR